MHTMTATGYMPRHTRSSKSPLAWVVNVIATRRQRVHLGDLDDRLLEDIGIDPATAHREAHRPLWDLPH